MSENLISAGLRAAIGAETRFVEAVHPVEASEVRRFLQATMHSSVSSGDVAAGASALPLGAPVPAAFPVHMFRRGVGEPDPLDKMTDPDFDGQERGFGGLPELDLPLKRYLNGGYEYEFFRPARIGERVFRRRRYKSIEQRQGKGGPMIVVLLEETYAGDDGGSDPILACTNTMIFR